MSIRKALKAGRLLRNSFWRTAVVRHRVAATIEHSDVINFCAPRSLIDVGANKGQFSTAVRGLFPEAVIHAFEPLPDAADRFAALFETDDRATLHRAALGAKETSATFYVTNRNDSSSFLKPDSSHVETSGVRTTREISVPVARMDRFLDPCTLPRPILMKIDVQGYELEVLRGIDRLDCIDYLYVELSFVELYKGQALYEDIRAYLAQQGMVLRGMFNQWCDSRLGPTQADGLFELAKR